MNLRRPDLAAVVQARRGVPPDLLRWAMLAAVALCLYVWMTAGQYRALPALAIGVVLGGLRMWRIHVETRLLAEMEAALDARARKTVLARATSLLSSLQRRPRIEAAAWASLAELAFREGDLDDAATLAEHVAASFPASILGRFQALCLATLLHGLRDDAVAAQASLDGAETLAARMRLTAIGAAQLALARVAAHVAAGRADEARTLAEGAWTKDLDASRRRAHAELTARLDAAQSAGPGPETL